MHFDLLVTQLFNSVSLSQNNSPEMSYYDAESSWPSNRCMSLHLFYNCTAKLLANEAYIHSIDATAKFTHISFRSLRRLSLAEVGNLDFFYQEIPTI